MGWSVSFWLGAVLLGALGGAMVARGLFGHRLIASRTRSCPRCRYDMTSHAGSMMVCPECGFGARDEADWYRGRRVVRPVLGGVVLLVAAFGLASRPTARQTGYFAMLPMSVQVRFWPEWRLAMRELGSENLSNWNRFLERVDSIDSHADSLRLTRIAYQECIQELRSRHSTSPVSREAASLLRLLDITSYQPPELTFVDTEDILLLVSSPHSNAASVGIGLALKLRPSSPEIVHLLLDFERSSFYSASINDMLESAYQIDRKLEWVVFDQILGNGRSNLLHRVVTRLEKDMWGDPEVYDYLSFWLKNGPADTQVHIARAITGNRLSYRIPGFGDPAQPPFGKLGLMQALPAEEMIVLILDQIESNSEPIARDLASMFTFAHPLAIPLVTQRLAETQSPLSAELMLKILGANGPTAASALPVIEEVRSRPGCPRRLQQFADQTIASIRKPTFNLNRPFESHGGQCLE